MAEDTQDLLKRYFFLDFSNRKFHLELIFGIALLFICLLNGIKERTKFIFYLAITVGLYVSLGFRYRLLLLFLPLALIYFFYKKIKPSITLLLSLVLSTIFLFGIIQLARTYGAGLDYDQFSRNISKKRIHFWNSY